MTQGDTVSNRKTKTHHVYVLPEHVNGRPHTTEPTRNRALAQMIEWETAGELTAIQQTWLNNYLLSERNENQRILQWYKAWQNGGGDEPGPEFGRTVAVDTSIAKGTGDLESIKRAIQAVTASNAHGQTSLEIEHGWDHGGISGALSKAHRAGVVVRLTEKR